VGPSLVITATHCLVDKRSKKYFRPQQIHFTAGLRGSRYTAHAIAKQILPSPKFDTTRRTPKDDAMHDWALLVLTEPNGNQFGYLGWRHGDKGRIIDNFKKRTKYVQAGYSQDQQRRLSAHAGCHFNGYLKSARLALHDCDAVSGASGSPIIQIFRGKLQLVGMHVGSIKRDNKNHGGAILSEQFGHALKRFVRAGGGKLPPGKKGRAAKHQIKLLQRRLGAAFPSKSSKLRP
jgi:protease YdgD